MNVYIFDQTFTV